MTDQTNEPDVKLDLQDLAGAVRVIDLAVERGAIKGEEASVVGKIRDNIVTFIKAHVPDEQAAEDTEAPTEAPTE